MGASEKAVTAVMGTLGCDPYWNTWVRPVRATCINRQHKGDWIPARGCPVAVAAADAAVDTDRPSIQAQALREAADEFGSAQLTGLFTRDEYPRAWLRARADRIEAQP